MISLSGLKFDYLLRNGTYEEIDAYYISYIKHANPSYKFNTYGNLNALIWYHTNISTCKINIEIYPDECNYEYVLYLYESFEYNQKMLNLLLKYRLYDLMSSDTIYIYSTPCLNVYNFEEFERVDKILLAELYIFSSYSTAKLLKINKKKVIKMHECGHRFLRGEETNHITDLNIFDPSEIYPYHTIELEEFEWMLLCASDIIPDKYKPQSPYVSTLLKHNESKIYLNDTRIVKANLTNLDHASLKLDASKCTIIDNYYKLKIM